MIAANTLPSGPLQDSISRFPSSVEMLHVKPVPPAPSVSRPRSHFTSKGKAGALAVQVSTIAAHVGNTITGWLLSELTAKSVQHGSSSRHYTFKKSEGSIFDEQNHPRVVFFTAKPHPTNSSASNLDIPVGNKSFIFSTETTVVDDDNESTEDDEVITRVELPRAPPPARTSPPPHDVPSPRKQIPVQFTESLPIAPKQLLPPIESEVPRSYSPQKPAPPPPPKEEAPSLAVFDFPLPSSMAIDLTTSRELKPPSTPVVPSTPRFNPGSGHRPKLQRTESSISDNSGFSFDFPPVVPEKDAPRRKPHKRSRDYNGRRKTAPECMQDFVKEYVEMRRNWCQRMGRDQRYPVAGQMMSITDIGSVYSPPNQVQARASI